MHYIKMGLLLLCSIASWILAFTLLPAWLSDMIVGFLFIGMGFTFFIDFEKERGKTNGKSI